MSAVTMAQAAALLGLPKPTQHRQRTCAESVGDLVGGREVLARIVPLSAPVGETEAEFYRRKARERSRRIGELERVVRNLRDAIDVLEERLREYE